MRHSQFVGCVYTKPQKYAIIAWLRKLGIMEVSCNETKQNETKHLSSSK
jgi:hypothetical protein